MKEFITRKINREYNAILLDGAEVWTDGQFKIAANNAEKGNDYLVMEMTWKSQDEIDDMKQEDFEKLLNEINKIKTTPWSGSDTKD